MKTKIDEIIERFRIKFNTGKLHEQFLKESLIEIVKEHDNKLFCIKGYEDILASSGSTVFLYAIIANNRRDILKQLEESADEKTNTSTSD